MSQSQYSVYSSLDSGAPTLDGLSGSLIRVLDACLINGYGSKSGVGWSRKYATTDLTSGNSGTQAVYQCPSGSASAFYLYVGDNAPHSSSLGREAVWSMLETVTGLHTGVGITGAFGLNMNTGRCCRKSVNATSSGVPWRCYADDRSVMLHITTNDSTVGFFSVFYGDIYSSVPNDAYNVMIMARNAFNNSAVSSEDMDYFSIYPAHYSNSYYGGRIMRNYMGLSSGIEIFKVPMYTIANGYTTSTYYAFNSWNGAINFPNMDGSIFLSPIWIVDNTTAPAPTIRGTLRGLYLMCNKTSQIPFSYGESFSGVGTLAGKSFMCFKYNYNGQTFALETTPIQNSD